MLLRMTSKTDDDVSSVEDKKFQSHKLLPASRIKIIHIFSISGRWLNLSSLFLNHTPFSTSNFVIFVCAILSLWHVKCLNTCSQFPVVTSRLVITQSRVHPPPHTHKAPPFEIINHPKTFTRLDFSFFLSPTSTCTSARTCVFNLHLWKRRSE